MMVLLERLGWGRFIRYGRAADDFVVINTLHMEQNLTALHCDFSTTVIEKIIVSIFNNNSFNAHGPIYCP